MCVSVGGRVFLFVGLVFYCFEKVESGGYNGISLNKTKFLSIEKNWQHALHILLVTVLR